MEKTDVLRRIVSLLLILTLITSAFVNLPLSVSAEGEGLQGGQSNIVNGSFEYPALRAGLQRLPSLERLTMCVLNGLCRRFEDRQEREERRTL